MMNVSEPTTTEIRRFLQGLASEVGMLPISKRFLLTAADRLESQERTINELEDECGKLKMTIDLLTARSEQAEAREKAAVKYMWLMRSCQSCKHKPEGYPHIRCACPDCDDEDKWEWRGLPQDGEGK